MSWDDSREKVFSGKIGTAEMDRLRALVDRIDLRLFNGEALYNSGPGVGDFVLAIDGAKGRHSLAFFGFMTSRYRKEESGNPLVALFCETRSIAQEVSSTGSLPGWCQAEPKQ